MKNDLGPYSISIISIFTWLGFVGAISFMEAWIKFQAPGVTLEIGLGIGQLVFHALNQVEWVLFLSAVLFMTFSISGVTRVIWWTTGIVGTILIVQTWVLLPQLDYRAMEFINENPQPSSYHHIAYIILEVLKVIGIAFWGIQLFTLRTYVEQNQLHR